MRFAHIFFLFLGFRIFDLLISYLAPYFIPYLGFFPYKEIAAEYHLPTFLTAFANFDGAHYLLIAKNGYTQYQQAFFPLYPLLVRFLSPFFFNNHLLTALVISNVSFLMGLFIFSKYLKLFSTSFNQFQPSLTWFQPVSTILFLLIFPTSFFFGTAYTESLFFLLFISTLYFLQKEKYEVASLFAFLASLTRFIGVFLIIPIFINIFQKLKGRINIRPYNILIFLTTNYKLLTAIISPLLGLTVYSLYLWQTTNDPLFFLHSQWAFGANRGSQLIFLPQVYFRYFMIFLTANWNFQYFISLFEFVTFNFVFVILLLDLIRNWKLEIKNFDRLGLNLFSLVNLLLPPLTGTFSSIPRYALFSLSFFIFLAGIKNRYVKIAIALILIVFHILILGLFSQGYFVS